MSTPSRRERAALADELARRGPDARTLCDGWTTADLASHVVLRERRPFRAAGVVIPPLAGMTERAMRRLRDRAGYDALVQMVREGPSRWSPLGWSDRVEARANTVELFVHHEDVRRGGPDPAEPRRLDEDLESELAASLRRMAPMTLRSAPGRIILRTPSGRTVAGGKGTPIVVVSGAVGELLLFAFGRQRAALVEYDGSEPAVAAARTGKLGV
ncbi:MAG: TIGR03085 family metal-binding protein [Mycobacteriales bacterium]